MKPVEECASAWTWFKWRKLKGFDISKSGSGSGSLLENNFLNTPIILDLFFPEPPASFPEPPASFPEPPGKNKIFHNTHEMFK